MKTWQEVRSNIKALNETEKEEIQNAVQLIASLVEMREKMGLSQKEIAIRSGVRRTWVGSPDIRTSFTDRLRWVRRRSCTKAFRRSRMWADGGR